MGCNTANGFGKDVSNAGEGIQNGTKQSQRAMPPEFINDWNLSAGFAQTWLVDSGRKRPIDFTPGGGPPTRPAVGLLAPRFSA